MISGFNKRGNAIVDLLVFIVIIFILATSWVMFSYIQVELNAEIQNDPDLAPIAKELNQDLTTRFPKIFDAGILLFFILAWALTIVASFMIDTHPVFFIFSFILLILVLVVVITLGNVFNEIFTTEIIGMASTFPLTFWIFDHFLMMGIVVGGTVLLSLFARPKA